jgi:hypothetical protein
MTEELIERVARAICVSCEHINYTPVDLEELIAA